MGMRRWTGCGFRDPESKTGYHSEPEALNKVWMVSGLQTQDQERRNQHSWCSSANALVFLVKNPNSVDLDIAHECKFWQVVGTPPAPRKGGRTAYLMGKEIIFIRTNLG